MIKPDQSLAWAIQYLTSCNDKIDIRTKEIVETSYSRVYEIKMGEQIIYLKKTPALLFHEPQMLALLEEQGVNHAPKLLVENPDLLSFLMTSCGEISLRNLFNKKINVNQLRKGIANFTNIQRLLENKIPKLLSVGTPDWRLDKFSSLYDTLLRQDKLLISDGLTEKEIEQLHQLYQTCVSLCERLSQYSISETIVHCDFHENNLLFDYKTKDINIIDWGETVISHPFFSLNGCLWNITYFYGVKESDLIYAKLQAACVKPWLDLHNEPELLNILNMANKLQGIFAALSYERIYIATKNQPKTVQQEHPGSIAGCLRTFINCNLSALKNSF